jgi:MFS family permease
MKPRLGAQPWYPLLRLGVALCLMTLGGSAMYASVLVLEPARVEFATGRGLASLPYGLFMLGFGVGGVLMGRLADRFGVLVPALLGSVVMPLGLVLAAQAQSIVSFALALSLLCGALGASFTFAPMVADISHWFDRRRGLAMGVVISGSYVAGAVWPTLLQGWFDTLGWRATFSHLGLLTGVLMVPLSLLMFPRPVHHEGAAASGHTAAAARHRPLGLSGRGLQGVICLAGIGCCVAMAMPQVHIVPYVLDLGLEAVDGARMLAIMLGFGIVSRIGSGWLSDRIGGLRTLILGSAAQGLVLVGFMFADSLVLLYAMSVAFGLAQGGIVPSYAMVIRRFFPARDAGWRIATALLFTIGGMALGGWMAGAIYDLTGSYDWSFVNAIAFNAFNVALALWLVLRSDGVLGGAGVARAAA